MAGPVTIKGFNRTSVELYEMFEAEVELSDSVFHHVSELGDLEFHNAYDADENLSMVRADAIFSTGDLRREVPVFASKDQGGAWRWLVRFQPDKPGEWLLQVRVLVRHPKASKGGEPKGSEKKASDNSTYYEHEFGFRPEDYSKNPDAQKKFTVSQAKRHGPLETPGRKTETDVSDNNSYFYRWTDSNGDYKRRPFFLYGFCRPWVVDQTAWDADLDREKELFEPMKKAGCNVLYHWLAPWESQLVHQSQAEFWPQPNSSTPKELPSFPGANGKAQLSGSNESRGYKRYDQGRAKRTDEIFDLAAKQDVLIFLVVMPHPALRDSSHKWGGGLWNPSAADPEQHNGFSLFKAANGPLSIEQFFQADPTGTKGTWARKLWKHQANFWRYVIARWGAHPAMGAWILIDEMEGIGKASDWWWDKGVKDSTYVWHDNIVDLLRGKLAHWKSEGRELPYTGDYLEHPLSASATDYNSPASGTSGNVSATDALQRLAQVTEIPDHGTWDGGKRGLDFFCHHAYQYVPTWGSWQGVGANRNYKPQQFTGWFKSNTESNPENIDANRWLWDSICQRIRAWSAANLGKPKLITEYGCLERKQPTEKWDHYGKRVPGFSHFANWAAVSQGLAGIPFKWNDGEKFGEMEARTKRGATSTIWQQQSYPPSNYSELKNIATFLMPIDLSDMAEGKASIVDSQGKAKADFVAWGRFAGSVNSLFAWVYDRTASVNGQDPKASIVLDLTVADREYSYEFFDTWAGTVITGAGATGSAKSDGAGKLTIALPRFPIAQHSTTRAASGNDIALRCFEKK